MSTSQKEAFVILVYRCMRRATMGEIADYEWVEWKGQNFPSRESAIEEARKAKLGRLLEIDPGDEPPKTSRCFHVSSRRVKNNED